MKSALAAVLVLSVLANASATRNLLQQPSSGQSALAFPHGPSHCRTYHQHHTHQNRSSILVGDDFEVASIHVSMNLTHPRVGAVKVQLQVERDGEEATHVTLKPYHYGGKGKNMKNTGFDDLSEEEFPIWASEAPFTGLFNPRVHLSKLNGPSKAKWSLVAKTRKGRHSTQIDDWALTLCDGARETPYGLPLPSEEYEILSAQAEGEATASAVVPVGAAPSMFANVAAMVGFFWFNVARTWATLIGNYNYANFFAQTIDHAGLKVAQMLANAKP